MAGRGTAQVAHVYLFTILAELIAARREYPADDLISMLILLELDGEPVTDNDVFVNCYSFIMGATPTVPQATSHLPLVLLEHLLRRTTAPVALGDEILAPGSLVAAWLASANRDETTVFTNLRRTAEAGALAFSVSEMLPDLDELWLPDRPGIATPANSA
jgi:cytochrome P450